MLNQTYLVHKKRKCRVALENASKQVEVHDDFRCIMIEEERDLQFSDPPRLNRCEKQCLTYLDVLHELGAELNINTDQMLAELQKYCQLLASFDTDPQRADPMASHVDIGSLTVRDAFIGFTEDALPSLLVREMQAATARVGASIVSDIRERCKSTLHDVMPADAVARCELSRFAQNPDNEQELRALITSYYGSKHHAGLRECFQYAWPHLLRLQGAVDDATDCGAMETDVEMDADTHEQPCLLVLTFTNYTCSIESILGDRGVTTANIKLLRLGAFESEKTLRSQVNNFWCEAEPRDMLVVQCDAMLHSQHLLLTREIMREAEEAYTDVAVAARRPKAQAIVLHLQRFQSALAGRWEFSHVSDWKQIVVDRLEGDLRDLDLLRAARETQDVTGLLAATAEEGSTHVHHPLPIPSLPELIKAQLPWALRRLGYPHSNAKDTLDYVKRVQQELLVNTRVLWRFEQHLRRELVQRGANKRTGLWLPQLAHDLGALVKASSLSALVREELVAAIRYPLALLLHRLESRSALAGLRSCCSTAQKQMWLDVYLPEDAASALEQSTHSPDGDWGLECLTLSSHHTRLRWAYSGEFEKQLRSRKAQFVELCAPDWTRERVASMRLGICLQFLSEEPLLRRLAMVAAQGDGDFVMADDQHLQDAELARVLEALWVDERERFRVDVQEILASELAARDVGISADRISTLIGAALLPAHSHVDDWHPADVCIQHWRVEATLRHALQLFLLTDGRFEPSCEGDFALELIDRAASSCLSHANVLAATPTLDQIVAWLGTAQRCINYARKMSEDCGVQLGGGLLEQLQICADFCTRVVQPHGGSTSLLNRATQALVHLATSDRVSADLLVRVISTLLQELESCDEPSANEARRSIDEFKYVWVARELQAAVAAYDLQAADNATAALGTFLREGTWIAGHIPPIIGRAIHTALEALELHRCYDIGRGNTRCFGSLTAAIEASMRTDDAALAAIICASLQTHFVDSMSAHLDRGSQAGSSSAEAALVRGPSLELSQMVDVFKSQLGLSGAVAEVVAAACAELRIETIGLPLMDQARKAHQQLGRSLDDGSSPKRQRLTSERERRDNFTQAMYALKTKLNAASLQASALYHLAFVKAFVQTACLALVKARAQAQAAPDVQQLLAALDAVLQLSNDQEPVASVQVYVLKELRRSHSIDEILQGFSSGMFGYLLPALKQRCASAVVLPTASKLGFDPFATYGDGYREARRSLQLSIDGQPMADGLPPISQATVFAIATALYFPHSLQPAISTPMAVRAATRCIPAAQRDSAVARFACTLAANRPAGGDVTVMDPQAQRLHVFVSSLAVHLAAVLDAADPTTNPLAMYTKQPARCTHASGLFFLCGPSNEAAIAMRAVAAVHRPVRCSCGFMYVIGDCGGAVTVGQCPQCNAQLGGQNYNLAAGQVAIEDRTFADADEPGFIADDATAYGAFNTVRELPALSYRVLHLLTRLSLCATQLLGHEGLDRLVGGQNLADCWAAALRDLPLIPPLLGGATEEETCAWLHDVIQRLPTWTASLGAERNHLNSAVKRQQWERDFATIFIQPHATTARACLAARPLDDGPRPMLHRLVDEEEGLAVKFGGLWSTTEQPSFGRLQAAFEGLGADGRTRHPLLALCVDSIELLEVAQHLWPFVQWERWLREQWGSHLDRATAREMTVGQLLEQMGDDALRTRATTAFEKFAQAWNAVTMLLRRDHTEASRRYAELCDCHPVKPAEMAVMDTNAPLILACIDEQICAEPAGNLFRLFLRMLARAQNDFLAAVVPMVPRCAALVALSLGGNAVWLDTAPQTALLQLQRQHVLLEDVGDVHAQMLRGCLSQAGYRVAGAMLSDFAAIEQDLATRLYRCNTSNPRPARPGTYRVSWNLLVAAAAG